MAESSTNLTTLISSTISTTLISSTIPTTLISSTINSISNNDSIYNLIKKYLNGTDLYKHQVADLIEPEKYSVRGIHGLMWTITILTYVLAIPMAVRMVRSRAYLNVIDYFSFHLIICAFIAWIPTLIFLLYYFFRSFTLKFCRLHYVILATNETVPIFFVLYMILERFLYAHPSIKQRFTQFSRMYFIHLYAIFTWLLILLTYAVASPFIQNDPNSTLTTYLSSYCSYNFSRLATIALVRSIIYFCILFAALVLIGFVLRYFFLMRGTNQVPAIQKLWTIRATVLLCVLVFYDIYAYYLEHVAETFRSFLLVSMLRSTFYAAQISVIIFTEPYWIEVLLERCLCLRCFFMGRRRKPTTPVPLPIETEISTFPFSASSGHYTLVDDTVIDEFDQVTDEPEPTLRVIV